MEVLIEISTAGLTLISSGSFITVDDTPVKMDVIIDDERTVSVLLLFHHERHPAGKTISHKVSEDRTVDEWHIYDSADNEPEAYIAPVPVVLYTDGCTPMALSLQLHTQRLSSGPVKVDYVWWDGERDAMGPEYKV